MTNPMDDLLIISREWAVLPDISHVAEAALSFLQRAFQLQVGFAALRGRTPTDNASYLQKNRPWFRSWGLETPDFELRKALDASINEFNKFKNRHWVPVEQLSAFWKDNFTDCGMLRIGVWMIDLHHDLHGVFVVASNGKGPREDDEYMRQCMNYIANLLELVVARQIAEELSLRDPLTGLFNRRGLLAQFQGGVVIGAPSRMLVVIDLDGFKRYNDEHGHQAGDKRLIQVAEILNNYAQLRAGVCARLGGDEFAIVIQSVIQSMQGAANRIASWLRENGISAGVGCAVLGVDGDNFDACYGIADLRLYEMKSPLRR